jgi:hypothetical protein
MGGSSLWSKSGFLAVSDLDYKKDGVAVLEDFLNTAKSFNKLKNNSNNDIHKNLEELLSYFPTENCINSGVMLQKDICSLYDSAHDFGQWKYNYDIISRNKDSDTQPYIDRMTFLIQGIYNYGISIDPSNKEFYENCGNINMASLGSGIKPSVINSSELENVFFLQAIKYIKDNTMGSFKKVNGKLFKRADEDLITNIETFFEEYKVNEITGVPDTNGKISIVVDANKKLFTKRNPQLWSNFIYLLTQEGISDPSPKKNPLKTNGIKPFTDSTFYYETNNQSNKREYDLNDVSGILKPSFGVMNNFKINMNYTYTDDKGLNIIIPKEILLNEPNHVNSIGMLKKRYNKEIIKDKKIQINILPDDSEEDITYEKIYNTIYGIPNPNSKVMDFNIVGTKDTISKLIENTISIFTSKRFGDQLQANCVRYINTWSSAKQNGIEFKNLSNTNDSFKPQRAVLVTHDRMLFAYALYNNIPVIFDYGKVLMVYKPNKHADILPQIINTKNGGGLWSNTIRKYTHLGGSSEEDRSAYKTLLEQSYVSVKSKLKNKDRDSDYNIKNIDPQLLFLLYIDQMIQANSKSKNIYRNYNILNILKKIFICSEKVIQYNQQDVLQYTNNIETNDSINIIKIDLNTNNSSYGEPVDIASLISDEDISIIESSGTTVDSKIVEFLKGITSITLQKPIKGKLLIQINSKLLDTYLGTSFGNPPSFEECIGVLNANVKDYNLVSDYNEIDIDSFSLNNNNNNNNNNNKTRTNTLVKKYGNRWLTKTKTKRGGGGGELKINKYDLFHLLQSYETKLLTDDETLNSNYSSYYINPDMSETKFYFPDDINIHVFLKLLQIEIETKTKFSEFNISSIKQCIINIERVSSKIDTQNNASDLLESINDIESYMFGDFNNPRPNETVLELQPVIEKCLNMLHKQVEYYNNKVYGSNSVKLLNYLFDNYLTQGSLSGLTNKIIYTINELILPIKVPIRQHTHTLTRRGRTRRSDRRKNGSKIPSSIKKEA